ncbi:hypothetical protein F5Y05DRAFT_416004 [Hypoxylon sp. FL0543]|nr:hypothetical protein F5Y05DRAFT_416004 [Hypoxylon sp. FL0543]
MPTPKEEIDGSIAKSEDLNKTALRVLDILTDDVPEDTIETIQNILTEDFEPNAERCHTLVGEILDSGFLKEVGNVDSWPAGWEEVHTKVFEIQSLLGGMTSALKECQDILGMTVQ